MIWRRVDGTVSDTNSAEISLCGGSVIPEPLTPYPYIATGFFTVIFVNKIPP